MSLKLIVIISAIAKTYAYLDRDIRCSNSPSLFSSNEI